MTGRYQRSRKLNEKETWQAHLRDQKERDNLIATQLDERQCLQEKIREKELTHQQEREDLIRELSMMKGFEPDDLYELTREFRLDLERELTRDDFNLSL